MHPDIEPCPGLVPHFIGRQPPRPPTPIRQMNALAITAHLSGTVHRPCDATYMDLLLPICPGRLATTRGAGETGCHWFFPLHSYLSGTAIGVYFRACFSSSPSGRTPAQPLYTTPRQLSYTYCFTFSSRALFRFRLLLVLVRQANAKVKLLPLQRQTAIGHQPA